MAAKPVGRFGSALLLTLTGLSFASESSHHQQTKPVVLAPGYSRLEFTPPAPGSYELPPLGRAGGGEVLTSAGEARQLDDFLGDKIVVLSFIYTTCTDVNGCPLASYVLRQVQHRLGKEVSLTDKVRLLSLSFDPQNDSPSVISEYSTYFKDSNFDWQFLTTASDADIDPILKAYDQFVIKDYDEEGRYLGTMSHILRVFLIDSNRDIRNIYSVSFLHTDMLINDIRTLLAEQD